MRKTLLIAAALLLGACSSDIQNADAVRTGIVDYLKANESKIGLNPDAMQIDVTSVSFQKNEARATVAFRPKQGDSGGPMTIAYVLDRKGNKWVVRGRTESGVNPHGASGMPALEPPQFPPELPPGHPDIGSKK